jgi:hypothetical protein
MPFVDFAEIRERLSIEDAAEMLPVQWKREAQQLRSDCPVHGGERSLIVTPSKGLFVCKATTDAKKGGDCIALCAHVMQTTNFEAGKYLAQQIGTLARNSTVNSHSNSTVSKERATVPQKREGGTASAQPAPNFDPVAFAAKLVFSEEVAALGFSEEDAEHFGVGFYRGKVYAPLRHPSGDIACFYDYGNGTLKLPARSRWLKQSAPNVIPFGKKTA